MSFNYLNDSIHVSFLYIYVPRADYSGPDILECKIIDLMDLEETLDFRLDVHTKFAQKDNFIFINSNSRLLHD